MHRRLFTALSVLSLVACLTTAALWVRSSRRPWTHFFDRSGKSWQILLSGGVVRLDNREQRAIEQRQVMAQYQLIDDMRSRVNDILEENARRIRRGQPPEHPVISAEFDAERQRMQQLKASLTPAREYSMPLWSILLVTAMPPLWLAVSGRHRRRRWRALHDRCISCSYNLTGNTSGVCPECGTPTTAWVKA